MAKGSSKGGKSGNKVLSLTVGNDTIDLSETPLVYGDDDKGLTGNARDVIEKWEAKRVKNKLEYNISVDQDGKLLHSEVKGGKTSVRVPVSGLQEGAIHTHIHPREDGLLGGTFSDGDLYNFANHGVATYRARAKEGAYSITKNKNFDKDGFKSYVSRLNHSEDAKLQTKMKEYRDKMRSDKSYTYAQYSSDFNKAFNSLLVSLHNGYMAGQKQYGYSYTLERGK